MSGYVEPDEVDIARYRDVEARANWILEHAGDLAHVDAGLGGDVLVVLSFQGNFRDTTRTTWTFFDPDPNEDDPDCIVRQVKWDPGSGWFTERAVRSGLIGPDALEPVIEFQDARLPWRVVQPLFDQLQEAEIRVGFPSAGFDGSFLGLTVGYGPACVKLIWWAGHDWMWPSVTEPAGRLFEMCWKAFGMD